MLTVEFDGKKLFIRAGNVLIPAISEWVGWKRNPHGDYIAPPWPSSVLAVGPMAAHGILWNPRANALKHMLLDRLQRAKVALGAKILPARGPTERIPKVHQSQAVMALRELGWRALLADDMGLGKTSTALWAAHDARVDRILVVCPVSVKFNWQAEVETTLGEKWATLVIDGTSQQRADQFADAQTLSLAKHLVVIINYDLLRHLPTAQLEWLSAFVRGGMLLLDESHYLKNRTAERSKLATGLAGSASYVIAMTGTPVRNLPDDLFSQIEIIRPGTWTSYRDFAKRHLVIQRVKFGKREVMKPVAAKNLGDLNALVNTLQIRRMKKDVLGLPPKTHTFPQLELTGDLLGIYKAMKDFARIELNKLLISSYTEEVTEGKPSTTVFDPRAKSAVEQAMRCEQIAQGFIGGIPDPVMQKLGSKLLRHAEKLNGWPNGLIFPHAPKLVWLLETIDCIPAQGGSPLVFSRFNAPIQWLAERLTEAGARPVCMTGATPAAVRQTYLNDFHEGRANVLIVQVLIAEGWNATKSQDVLFLGRDWSPAINMQAEDRAHRIGQTGTVNVQVPIVRGTIEVMIDKRLRAKNADAQQALRNMTIAELMESL